MWPHLGIIYPGPHTRFTRPSCLSEQSPSPYTLLSPFSSYRRLHPSPCHQAQPRPQAECVCAGLLSSSWEEPANCLSDPPVTYEAKHLSKLSPQSVENEQPSAPTSPSRHAPVGRAAGFCLLPPPGSIGRWVTWAKPPIKHCLYSKHLTLSC